jgi:uncharacterized membrane protein
MRLTKTAAVFRGEWGVPAIYVGVAMASGIIFPRVEGQLFPNLVAQVSTSAAMSFYSAIASGMITLTGIVFSFTFVMVQFSATAYSPRLVQWISRDPVISHALGVFAATFLYAISALVQVGRGGGDKVPFISGWIVVTLLLVSTGMFIALIRRISLLRVDRMLVFTGDMGRAMIEATPAVSRLEPGAANIDSIRRLPVIQTLIHEGHPCSVQAVDIEALVNLAAASGGAIEIVAAVGDTVVERTTLLRVLGAAKPIDEAKLGQAITLGMERTFEQDPKYAIRLLVDIAIKALSPAINDPTTAVQALDQIEDLLFRLAQRDTEIGVFCDNGGKVRLLVPFPGWEDLLALALVEIAFCGATSVQVMRRMNALIRDLTASLPEERRPALGAWSQRLNRQVRRVFVDAAEQAEALKADRQGLGATRVSHATE